jgi:hypothetical protein
MGEYEVVDVEDAVRLEVDVVAVADRLGENEAVELSNPSRRRSGRELYRRRLTGRV